MYIYIYVYMAGEILEAEILERENPVQLRLCNAKTQFLNGVFPRKVSRQTQTQTALLYGVDSDTYDQAPAFTTFELFLSNHSWYLN
jgi:hypothetical protein